MTDSSEDDAPGLQGFLFGNVDENNQLDADYLDAVRFHRCSEVNQPTLCLPACLLITLY